MAYEVFRIGDFSVRGYGLMIGIGIALAFALLPREMRRRGMTALDENFIYCFLAIALACFAGGKLLFIIAYREAWDALRRSHGAGAFFEEGFVFYGAILLCVPTAVFVLRRLKTPVLEGMDVMALSVPLIHGLGRIGCFLSGCCYGCRSDGPLAVTFTGGIGLHDVPVHPVQLYESAAELAVFAWMWLWLRTRVRFPGQIVLAYFITYGVVRFTTGFFRGDGNPSFFVWGEGTPSPGDPPQGLTLGQMTSLVLLAICVPLLIVGLRRARARALS